jgi:chitin disaccharide deacetylase
MLIINADDLGRSVHETDAALACFARRRITSTSAMVFMADSERAAALARDAGVPVGLHLNLSEAYSAQNVPRPTAECHDRVRRFLCASRYALLAYNPLLSDDFAAVVQSQLREFERLYGQAPCHLDGHQHMHLSTNVLLQKLLPQGLPVRRNFSFLGHQKSALNRWYRSRVDRALARRHRLTAHFFSLSQQLHAQGMTRVTALAGVDAVELMVHPAWPLEWDFLMGSAGEALQPLLAPCR